MVAMGVCTVLLGDGDCSGLDMGDGATETEGEGSADAEDVGLGEVDGAGSED